MSCNWGAAWNEPSLIQQKRIRMPKCAIVDRYEITGQSTDKSKTSPMHSGHACRALSYAAVLATTLAVPFPKKEANLRVPLAALRGPDDASISRNGECGHAVGLQRRSTASASRSVLSAHHAATYAFSVSMLSMSFHKLLKQTDLLLQDLSACLPQS
jgi:hypothetical protein